MRARLRIDRNAAGVVVHVGGNQARAHHREQQREALRRPRMRFCRSVPPERTVANLSEMALQSIGCFRFPSAKFFYTFLVAAHVLKNFTGS